MSDKKIKHIKKDYKVSLEDDPIRELLGEVDEYIINKDMADSSYLDFENDKNRDIFTERAKKVDEISEKIAIIKECNARIKFYLDEIELYQDDGDDED